jgi:hypothetical protein
MSCCYLCLLRCSWIPEIRFGVFNIDGLKNRIECNVCVAFSICDNGIADFYYYRRNPLRKLRAREHARAWGNESSSITLYYVYRIVSYCIVSLS